ncbi:zinc finger protein 252-like [Schistocerca serialis cubense]|uniref:zinc finger protein 252-like n=1 Tax=Schistocerca serialis cubense TaxID=2023355 RepID=UPI00214EB52B|nr:zinc finger protein 252-like [Schistocerca serialis cubense]
MESSLLACPICTQPGFINVDSLCHGLLYASTREFLCPVCNDVLRGLDKFTIHLFSHSILRGQHIKGVQSSTSIEEQSVLSSKIAGPLSLNLKKPLIICDSFADFRVSSPVDEDSRQHKEEESSQTTCNIHNLTFEHGDCVREVCAAVDDSRSAVDDAVVGSTSENTQEGSSCAIISNNEASIKELRESEASPTVTQSFQQNIYNLLPSEGKRACADEIAMPITKVTDSESTTEKRPSNEIANQFGSSGHCTTSSAVCEICQFSFTEDTILEMHKQLIHSDLSPRSSDSALESDNADVGDVKNYPCLLCPKSFRMKGSLMVHVRVAHNGFPAGRLETFSQREQRAKDDRSYTCSTCDKSFKKENHLTQHMKTHDGKQWACDVCSKLFTTKYFLKKHKRLHTGEMPYRCGICDKTFTFQQSYHKHLLYHSDEKPHVCTECDRAFKELSTLHNHQRIHTGEKPFACETCGKCFRQRVSYLVHRRIHTGVMPYKCTACGKNFRYKVSQRTHKCPSQPPGTVVRQSSDLVQKLRQAVEVKPLQEKHIVTNGVLAANVKEGCSVLEKHHTWSKETQLVKKQQNNDYIILANSHIQSALSHDVMVDSSPILWITGEVEKSQTKDTGLESLHMPQIVGLCDTKLQQVQKDSNDETVTRSYPLKYSPVNKTMGNDEIFYEEICNDEKDTNFVNQSKTANTTATKMYSTKLKNVHNISHIKGCPSSKSSDMLNIVMSSLSQSEASKNPGVFHENNDPFTLNIPVVFNTSAESMYLPNDKQNILTSCKSENPDLGNKSDVCIGNTCGAAVSQSKFTQESDSGTHEASKCMSPPQQMLTLNEESLNLFYDTDI